MNNFDDPGPLILCDQQMHEVQSVPFLEGQAVIYSSRCPGKESANEDALALVATGETSGVLLLADGMGGHAGGELAARTAIQAVVDTVRQATQDGVLIRSAIMDGFERAHQQIQASGTGGGTTLSVVEFDGRSARPYHAGDSIILVVGSKGKIKLQTTSHSPVGFGVAAGLLDADEAMHHEDRHVILNAIGSGAMRIEIGTRTVLSRRDTILIASDGLSDNLLLTEIVNGIRIGNLSRSLSQLVYDCSQRMASHAGIGKPDDMSVIAFRPFGQRPPKQKPARRGSPNTG